MNKVAEAVEQTPARHNPDTFLSRYIEKMRGGGVAPARASLRTIAITWLGGFLAITTVALLTSSLSTPLVLGSFGATCVLVFGFPESPLSQPRNVIGGHVLSSFIGLLFLHVLGAEWWSMATALATAIALMQLTRTVHPPAGSNPIIVFLAGAQWPFLFTPTMFGSMLVVLVALLYNNIPDDRKYPNNWL